MFESDSVKDLHVYAGYKSECDGVDEEEKSLDTSSYKNPVFHNPTACLAVNIQVLAHLITLRRVENIVHLYHQSPMCFRDLVIIVTQTQYSSHESRKKIPQPFWRPRISSFSCQGYACDIQDYSNPNQSCGVAVEHDDEGDVVGHGGEGVQEVDQEKNTNKKTGRVDGQFFTSIWRKQERRN